MNTREMFSKAGLRCTKQRELVFAALASTTSHPTAEEIFSTVREAEPGLSLATVYNTLEVFTRRGLCRRLAGPPGATACRYDADLTEHAHLALPDGRMVDLPKDLSDRFFGSMTPDLVADVESRLGVRVARVAVQIICEPERPVEDQESDAA